MLNGTQNISKSNYAFGSVMNQRTYTAPSTDYKYGFNGQEKDDEVAGEGNSYTAEFWQYDGRLGRRWNLDPKPAVDMSHYACFGNNPFLFCDPLGDIIKLSGDKKNQKTFLKQLNARTGNNYKVKSDGTLYNKNKNSNQETNSKKSKELSDIVEGYIKNGKTVTLDLVKNDADVLFDSYKTGKVDVGDLAKADPAYQAGQIAHFLTERFENKGDYSEVKNRTRENFTEAHEIAKEAESKVVTGMLGIPYSLVVQPTSTIQPIIFEDETLYILNHTSTYGNTVYTYKTNATDVKKDSKGGFTYTPGGTIYTKRIKPKK